MAHSPTISRTALEAPNQIAAIPIRNSDVPTLPATLGQPSTVVSARHCLPNTRTSRIATTGAWASRIAVFIRSRSLIAKQRVDNVFHCRKSREIGVDLSDLPLTLP